MQKAVGSTNESWKIISTTKDSVVEGNELYATEMDLKHSVEKKISTRPHEQ